jgi:myo-inositol 2-dehydrogenase/D-chiro-inositol 1-dehydrogenase
MTEIRFAVLGCGRIGTMHAEMLTRQVPGASVSVVFDVVAEASRAVGESIGARGASSLAEAVAADDVDAVAICTNTDTHVDAMVAAAQAGKAIFCEKPLSLSLTEIDRGLAAVEVVGVNLQVGFNRRFDPSHKAVADAVRHGAVGDVHLCNITSRDPGPPPVEYLKTSGGLFNDMTIHDFDMARFFLPDIVEVSATGTTTFDPGAREHGDFDTAVITLRSASGAIVSITNSRHSAVGYDQRIEAFGELGSLSVANMPTSLVSVSGAAAVEARPPYQSFFLERYADAYAAELHEFIKLARGEASTSPTFEDGRAALVLADAAQRSATERVIVPVDLS